MAQNWSNWCWHLGLASSLAIGGAIASSGDCTFAQLTPDSTLPNNSIVTPSGDTSIIEGGTQAGTNLFHSFTQFSVPNGNTAYFNNASQIQNIFSRVTGGSISDIDGVIRSNGAANLFLLNPNGIIFGPNARLEVGGSFLASTASRLNFADGNQFSATAPQTTPLLTVSVPIGLQFGGTALGISIQGSGLEVEPGKTLALVSGDITLEGGDLAASEEPNLAAPAGRIELGSVAGGGEVSLNQTGDSWVLGYDRINAFRDIRLKDGAFINASGEGGGDIQIRGAQLDLTEGSYIFADTEGAEAGGEVLLHTTEALTLSDGSQITADVYGSGTGGDLTIEAGALTQSDESLITADVDNSGTGGDLTIKAGALTLSDSSQITADVNDSGTGGNLTIETGQLSIRGDRSLVSASNYGQGKGGNLVVNASDSVELLGGIGSGLFTQTQDAGTAGNLTIEVATLTLSDGSQITADVSGSGTGGDLTIEAGAITLSDGSLITADVNDLGTGGNLTIETGQLSIQGDKSRVSANTEGQGKGGNLIVNAFDSVELLGGIGSGLFTQTQDAGTAGNLTITTRRLNVQNGARVSATSTAEEGQGGNISVTASDSVKLVGFGSGLFAQTLNAGNTGNLTIATRQLSVQDGAQVSTRTLGEGQGGNLSVTAFDSVELMGRSPDGQIPSGLLTLTEGAKDAGNLTIATNRLIVGDGARVTSRTSGLGKGGELQVNATESVNIFGVDSNRVPSGLSTSTLERGQGGNIIVNTSAFRVADNAVVTARTLSVGNGGNITVNANTFEAVNGGQLLASTFEGSSGRAGNITVNTTDSITISGSAPFKRLVQVEQDVFVEDDSTNSGLFVGSRGSGDAGNLQLTTRTIRLDDKGELTAQSNSGQGGDIDLQAQDLLLLRDESQISTTAGIAGAGGDGGNIEIDTNLLIALQNSNITANAFNGRGGHIRIRTQGLFRSPDSDITAFSQQNPELNGVVEINTLDVDPSQGLVSLPTELLDVSGLVAQGCPAGSNVAEGLNEFIISGRGGLPPEPSEALRSDAVLADLGTPVQAEANPNNANVPTNTSSYEPTPLVEAQGWIIGDNGEVVLTASAPTVTPDIPWLPRISCHATKTSSSNN